MRNMLRALEKATLERVPLTNESLGIDPSIFLRVAKSCGYEPSFKPINKGMTVKLESKNIPVVMLYDGEESQYFNFLDLSDLHVGHKNFDVKELDKILSRYYEDGKPSVDYVFIAGDLLEGIATDYYTQKLVSEDRRELKKVTEIRNEQVNTLVNVLMRYDFDYRVINGNHEYGFEMLGLEPPLRLVEKKMRNHNKKFTFYDTYVIDFIIAGICKRMMHVESFESVVGDEISCERLKRFKKESGLMIRYKKKWYPIRFLQCGHLHKRRQMFDKSNKIYITQPGSFVQTEQSESPGILVRGQVLKNKMIEVY